MRLTVFIDGKYSHIRQYRWNDFPLILILGYNEWNNGQVDFHLLQITLPNSTYYVVEGANKENKPKFRRNPDFKLMGQVLEVLRYQRHAYRMVKRNCQWILRYIRYFGSKARPLLPA